MNEYAVLLIGLGVIAIMWAFGVDPEPKRDRRFRGWPFDLDPKTDRIRRRIDPDYWGD